MQLPPPVMEQTPNTPQMAETLPASATGTPEQGQGRAEQASSPQPAAPQAAMPVSLPQVLPPTATGQPSATAPTATTPPIADDSDLIEKEWVHRAKQIVERTRDDPYKQSEELTGVKVDYMKKRYNKTIKLNQ